MTDAEFEELEAQNVRLVAETTKDDLVKELKAAYTLLESACPLALRQLYAGGVWGFEQYAFWGAESAMADFIGTFSYDKKPEGDWDSHSVYGTVVQKRIQELEDFLNSPRKQGNETANPG